MLEQLCPRVVCVAMVAIAFAPTSRAAANETVEAVTIDGNRERVLVVHDDARPVSDVLIVFTGGDGHLGLTDEPPRPGAEAGYVASLRRDLLRPELRWCWSSLRRVSRACRSNIARAPSTVPGSRH